MDHQQEPEPKLVIPVPKQVFQAATDNNFFYGGSAQQRILFLVEIYKQMKKKYPNVHYKDLLVEYFNNNTVFDRCVQCLNTLPNDLTVEAIMLSFKNRKERWNHFFRYLYDGTNFSFEKLFTNEQETWSEEDLAMVEFFNKCDFEPDPPEVFVKKIKSIYRENEYLIKKQCPYLQFHPMIQNPHEAAVQIDKHQLLQELMNVIFTTTKCLRNYKIHTLLTKHRSRIDQTTVDNLNSKPHFFSLEALCELCNSFEDADINDNLINDGEILEKMNDEIDEILQNNE